MPSLTRALRPVVPPSAAVIAVLAVALTAGCQSSSSSSSSAAAASATSQASAAAAASPAPSGSISATMSAGTVTPARAGSTSPGFTGTAVAMRQPMRPPGTAVYFAGGGDMRGTTVHEPGCAVGCPLSGDGTTSLFAMTWPTWTGTEAVGTGIEKIDDCTPNCAQGTLHPVKVIVTFTKPVRACVASVGHWYWTRVSFAWPDGLPAALKGANAPTNPVTYAEIASQPKSCA